ncbi:MAG: hypothetical protein AAGN66_22885 [Acidobacteriota bacterium]
MNSAGGRTFGAGRASLRPYFEGPWAGWRSQVPALALGGFFLLTALSMFVGVGFGNTLSQGCVSLFALPGAALFVWGAAAAARRSSRLRRDGALRDPAEVQELLEREILAVEAYALGGLGMDPDDLVSEGPMVLLGSVDRPLESLGDIKGLIRKREGAEPHLGAYSVTLLAPAQNRLGVFQGTYNFVEGRMVETRASEYRYGDVKAVRTVESEAKPQAPEDAGLPAAREIQVQIAGGDEIRISASLAQAWSLRSISLPPEDPVEATVRILRKYVSSTPAAAV